MKTYLKTLVRAFKRHYVRFFSIIFMVVISVGFIAGLGMTTDKIDFSAADYYKRQNVSDFIIKSKSDDGFSPQHIADLKAFYGNNNVSSGFSADYYLTAGDEAEKLATRIYFSDEFGADAIVNIPEIKEGAAEGGKVFAEQKDNIIEGVEIGSVYTFDFEKILDSLSKQGGGDGFDVEEIVRDNIPPSASQILPPEELEKLIAEQTAKLREQFKAEAEVCATVLSPLTFANDGEPSFLNPADTPIPNSVGGAKGLIVLKNIIYAPSSLIPEAVADFLPTTDVCIALPDRGKFEPFGKSYQSYIDGQRAEVLQVLGMTADDVEFITLNENYSFLSLRAYAEKVEFIGWLLMVVFVLVTALVGLSTMTRLMEEERAQMACLRTLGYSQFKIVFKYLLFAAIAAGVGGVGAYFVGLGLASLLYHVFNFSFAMPPAVPQVTLLFFLITFLIIVGVMLIATLFAGLKMTGEAPANLLRPKPPKVGKKVFLERIPFIWNRFSFKYKSTLRNVLRYMSRFLMTVISVAVSSALVLVALALLDVCLFGGLDSPAVMGVAVVIIVFAGLLTMAVIYTLTNINVSERNRELATLKVLGYNDGEVCGYIYREVIIDTVVGILFGYPASLPLMKILFDILESGTIGGVSWFWWLVAPAIVLAFTFLVTLMLRRRIVKIDMNESLKAIE